MYWLIYLSSTHADRQGVDISFTVFFVCLCVCVCVCVWVRLRISSPRIKLAASNFSQRFIGVQGRRNHTFLWPLFPQKPQIGRIGQRAGRAHRDVNITVEMRRRKRHARDASFVEYRAAGGSACVDIGRSPHWRRPLLVYLFVCLFVCLCVHFYLCTAVANVLEYRRSTRTVWLFWLVSHRSFSDLLHLDVSYLDLFML